MPQLGAFARMWKRDSVAEIAEAMAAEGLVAAQWNFSALGQPAVSEAAARKNTPESARP